MDESDDVAVRRDAVLKGAEPAGVFTSVFHLSYYAGEGSEKTTKPASNAAWTVTQANAVFIIFTDDPSTQPPDFQPPSNYTILDNIYEVTPSVADLYGHGFDEAKHKHDGQKVAGKIWVAFGTYNNQKQP
jgi:hypothetical protein